MSKTLEYLIVIGLIVSAVVTAWSVLTINHLNIG
ncbi:hypothetical protein [Campylobacter helveticus]|uniref:Uncharacterized protein n=1 Tax=Campylobacter helveticus TaxID=28898 RepID=A0AAX2ULV2_9BACT|nr:hypothetical protein [Campylobacter helveticus]MCR2039029.1 hypothetical protein [Campylobacter helveticus]MCR2054718.1 hypothetical protein [Campylobacter helveticus]MCR2056544.1 hypothetical protein [Campylobacter helveticus]MCR2059365.1 hypothetical protein [Campylobacter helveticus]MCR2062131.1 hypothetical protein [Campylobacter helveticus]